MGWQLSPEYGLMIPHRNDGANAIFALYTSVFGTGVFTPLFDKVIISARIKNQTASDEYDRIAFPPLMGATGGVGVVTFSGPVGSLTYLTGNGTHGSPCLAQYWRWFSSSLLVKQNLSSSMRIRRRLQLNMLEASLTAMMHSTPSTDLSIRQPRRDNISLCGKATC